MTCLGLIYIYFIIPETVTKKNGKIEFCQKCYSSLIDGYKYYKKKVSRNFHFSSKQYMFIFRSLKKPRPNGLHKLLYILLIIIIFTEMGSTKNFGYMYTQKAFGWDVSDYTYFIW